MKRLINLMLVCMTLVVFASCERVAPNYAGVLRGLTKEILYKQFIDKWDGETPIYGAIPDLIKLQK